MTSTTQGREGLWWSELEGTVPPGVEVTATLHPIPNQEAEEGERWSSERLLLCGPQCQPV